MRAKDLFDHLPRFEELVDHPQVREAMERWKQSEAVSRVRSAIEDLGAEASRRSEQWSGVTPSEMIQRLASRLQRATPPIVPACVNATGVLWGGELGGPPVAAAAIDRMASRLGAYCDADALRRDAEGRIAETAGCASAIVTQGHSASLACCLSGLGEATEVIVSRAEVTDIEPGVRLPELCRVLGISLREVGDAGGATLEDYQSALELASGNEGQAPVLLRRTIESHELIGGAARPATVQLAELARPHNALLVEDLGGATLQPTTMDLGVSPCCASSALAAGANLVLVKGDGLIGAPRCGIVLGKSDLVSRAASVAAAVGNLGAPSLVDALLATLELLKDPERLPFEHPLYALLDAPLENLRGRADRLAQLLAATDEVEAEAREAPADAAPGPRGLVRLPSWRVLLRPQSGSAGALIRRLQTLQTPIFAVRNDSETEVELDLRTVHPAQDSLISAAFSPLEA